MCSARVAAGGLTTTLDLAPAQQQLCTRDNNEVCRGHAVLLLSQCSPARVHAVVVLCYFTSALLQHHVQNKSESHPPAEVVAPGSELSVRNKFV
jgi:hypothetical protein